MMRLNTVRTAINLPKHQVDSLDEVCHHERISRAEAILRAVALYLDDRGFAQSDAFGLWRHRRINGVAYQRKLRRELVAMKVVVTPCSRRLTTGSAIEERIQQPLCLVFDDSPNVGVDLG